ncbi:MAG TPA: hypothetical protein VF115_16345 [Acidimicrobiia bacterium]
MFVGTGLVVEGIASHIVGTEPPVNPTAIDVVAITWANTAFFFALVIPLVLSPLHLSDRSIPQPSLGVGRMGSGVGMFHRGLR